ncbi:hypothetical protein SESBI_32157 [Sesbania bispinosa]|nr:hypothetical protein SESBI_32157 [Sesbania bispinosa]
MGMATTVSVPPSSHGRLGASLLSWPPPPSFSLKLSLQHCPSLSHRPPHLAAVRPHLVRPPSHAAFGSHLAPPFGPAIVTVAVVVCDGGRCD